jgi:hypothetical protein
VTITVFIPDWDADDKLREKADSLLPFRSQPNIFFGDFQVAYSAEHACFTITLRDRLEATPAGLQDVPMTGIMLIKHNSPVTHAPDGVYVDDDIIARVDTFIRDGVRQQTITVTGTFGTSLEELNDWFDALVRGKKNDYNADPITYPDADRALPRAIPLDDVGTR